MSNPTTNKRIAQNAIFLYIRMLLVMAVSLYTSRVVLATLGVDDYGIYNVVGGVVSLFAFLQGTISGVTQRFLTFELGTGNQERLRKVFNTAMSIHIIIAIFILLLTETIGLWFVLNKLVIPEERMTAAIWVYQFSIASSVVFFLSIPYNACIIAHEKMSVFAYISIIEVILKLAIVYLLVVFKYDKLVLYAILMFSVQLLIRMIYSVYCRKHFVESRYNVEWDKPIAKEMAGFTTWSLFGGFASVGYSQGINILLNMFFGPVVNAARAITVQVDSAVQGFVSNFQMALNPQIIKSYASNDLIRMRKLVFASSRYSYYLLFLLVLPIFIEAPLILDLWLKNVPEHTVGFLRITLLVLLINSLSNPLITSANATGTIKRYQMVVGSILLAIVPIAYISLKFGCSPEFVFWIYFTISLVAQCARIYMIRNMINLSIKLYVKEVVWKIILVSFTSSLIPVLLKYLLPLNMGYAILITLISFVSVIFSVYSFGMSRSERITIKSKVKSINILRR